MSTPSRRPARRRTDAAANPDRPDGLVEQLDGIAWAPGATTLRLERAAAPRGGAGPSGPCAVAHSAEIRYR